MPSILVGIDGTPRGDCALEWAAREAERSGSSLALLAVIDPAELRKGGITVDAARESVKGTLETAEKTVAEKHPGIACDLVVAVGKIVDQVSAEADKHDMVVLGSHHGATIGETIGGAKGLRVSVLTKAPTVVVPSDWNPAAEGKSGVVVGVGPDGVSEAAVAFGVRMALELGEHLSLVSAWGLPPLLSKPAEAMGGSLGPVGVQFQQDLDERVTRLQGIYPDLKVSGHAVEGSSPSRVLLDYAKDASLLVLGTHARDALGRALFGSVSHSVLLNLNVPTVVASQV